MIDSETSLPAVDVQLIHVEAPRERERLTGAVGIEPEEVGLQVAHLEISLYGMQGTARESRHPVESEGGYWVIDLEVYLVTTCPDGGDGELCATEGLPTVGDRGECHL